MPVVSDKYRSKKEYLLAHAALVLAAHSRSFLTYTGIAELTGLPDIAGQMSQAVGQLLGGWLIAISKCESAGEGFS